MKKKFLVSVLAAALVLTSVFSGCAGNQKTPASTNTNSGSAASENSSQSAGNSTPMKLSVEVFDRSDAPSPYSAVDNPMSKWMKQQLKSSLNLDMNFVAVPRSEEINKLNIMMAGGTAPDIIFTYHSEVAANFAKEGGLTDLSSYIDQYAPNVKTNLKETLPYGVIEGKQYTIPSKRVNDYDMHMVYVNTMLLKKYNMKMPTKKEELYEDMAKIHKADPSIIGFAMAAPTYDVKYYEEMILSYAKYQNDKEKIVWNISDTRLVAPGTKDGYRELNKWYSEGLISKEFALDTKEKQYISDITNGNVFSFMGQPTDAWGYEADAQKANGSYYMPALVFENDKGQYANPLYIPVGVYSMVPKANESHAAAAMKYLNWLLDDKNFNQIRTGAAIGASKQNSDGIYIPTVKDLKEKGVTSAMLNDMSLIARSYVDYKSVDKQKEDSKVNNSTVPDIDKLLDSYYSLLKPEGSYTIPYIGAPGEASGKYGSNINDMVHSMAARVIACKPSIFDATYDKEYQKLQDAGLKAIISEREQQYDTYKKSNG
mgnify:FL=1|jgi:putative aldouronate transport system substrate-binding protein